MVNEAVCPRSTEWFKTLRSELEANAEGSQYLQQQGELMAHRDRFAFYEPFNPLWLMDHGERAGMYMLLDLIKPGVAIEIGVHYLGSTFLLSQFAQTVYAVDVAEGIRQRCAGLANVVPLIGDSNDLVPKLLEQLRAEGRSWDLALVDGDHSAAGVRRDLETLIESPPLTRCYIVMHDSFNPECRKGILGVDWDRPWVHEVEVDFTLGNLNPHPHALQQMWGGLALAELSPAPRTKPLVVGQEGRLLFQAAFLRSAHAEQP